MLDCVLVARDDTVRRHVIEVTGEAEAHARLTLDLPVSAGELPKAKITEILAADPHVVFVDLGDDDMTGVRVLEALSAEAPDLALVTSGPQLDSQALLQVIRAGADEYLPRPVDAEEVRSAFRRIRRRVGPASPRPDEPGMRGTLTTLVSAKGGSGVTTLAVNLAVLLQERGDDDVLLLDLTPAMGTAALLLGLQPRYSYLDVVQNFHRIDPELLESFVDRHGSGLSVLSSPPLPPGGEPPTTDQILGLVRFCRRFFGHVVVDGGTRLLLDGSPVLAESDHELVVATPELPALRNLKSGLDYLGRFGENGSAPPQVVVNQLREDRGITVAQVREALGRPVAGAVAWDAELLLESANLGRPAVGESRSRFARSLARVGADLLDEDVSSPSRSGLLKNLLRPFRGSPNGRKESRE